ncbi:type I polyketide synthase [Venturia nashicola]|nr:type I polyketide synthase [Venturia nashicola]
MEYFGFCPDYVVGHSLGEVAAAHAAGVLSLADAATLVTARGMLVAALPDGGSLVSVSASADDVNEVLQDLNVEANTVVAAVNAQTSVVVSGPTKIVIAIKDLFTKRGRPATYLRVSHAFHSPMMAPMSPYLVRIGL